MTDTNNNSINTNNNSINTNNNSINTNNNSVNNDKQEANGYDPTPFNYESVSLHKYMYDTNTMLTEVLRQLQQLNHTMVYIAQELENKQKTNTKEQVPLMGLNTIKSN